MVIELEWQGENKNEKGIVKKVNSDKLKSILVDSDQYTVIERWTLNSDKLLNSYSLLLSSVVVSVDPKYYRPTEVDLLLGNPAKAKLELGWEAKTKWDELARLKVREDYIKLLKGGN